MFTSGRTRLAVLVVAALATAACQRRQTSATRGGDFAPCNGQRYLSVTNGTSRSYDVYLRTSSSRIYITTVYAESRVDAPIDASITSGTPELVEIRQARRRIDTGQELGRQYAVVVCR